MTLSRSLALFCILFASTGLWAQADDSNEDGPAVPTSTLAVQYDQQGQAIVSFFTDQNVKDWAPLRVSLENSLHCSAGTLRHPPMSNFPQAYLDRLPAKRRQEFEAQMAQSRSRQLQGTCASAMMQNQFVLSADLSFKDVLQELKQIGDQQLAVNISFPKAGYFEYTHEMLQSENVVFPRANYLFKVDGGHTAFVNLVFGYRRKEVYQALSIPAVFFVLPLLIMLCMQRAAIRGAKDDSTAAWFSYFRVLNVCTLVTMLLWILGHSLRQGVDDLVDYRFASNSLAAIAIRVAILMVPPWMVYLLCLLSSYRVYVHVRGLTWSRRGFYATQVLQVAAQAVPLMCLIAAIDLLRINPRSSMALFVAVGISSIIFARLRVKITGIHPVALTAGELRDCVFDLAKRAATELRQVFVLPAGKAQITNAFASGNKTIIFTDYLLARLNKREVTAVAAHEITHLQRHHANWKLVGMVGLVLSPMLLRIGMSIVFSLLLIPASLAGGGMLKFVTVMQRVQTFSELDLVFYLCGLSLFYLQSRIMENAADLGAVRLTGDPEALMTGLLKLGRLNLMPVQWGRVSGTLLTHPSTMKRIQRIAKVGQVPPARVQQIIAQYQQTGNLSAIQAPDLPASEDTFAESVVPANRVIAAAQASQSALSKLFVLLFFHIAPPIAALYAIRHLHLQGRTLVAAYAGGAVLCVVIYGLLLRWMGTWGRKQLQRQFDAKMKAEGLTVADQATVLVGFSPDATTRFYAASYNWDRGYLLFRKDRLFYVGEQARFALRADQIRSVRLGSGVPSWFPVQRIFVDWWDESRLALRTCNIVPMRPCSFWHTQKEALHLYELLRRWMRTPSNYAETAHQLATLEAPKFGEVTSRSPKSMHTIGRALKLAAWMMLLAIGACVALNIPVTLYVCVVLLLIRLYEHIPYWRYKEQPTAGQSVVPKAIGVSTPV